MDLLWPAISGVNQPFGSAARVVHGIGRKTKIVTSAIAKNTNKNEVLGNRNQTTRPKGLDGSDDLVFK